MRRVDLAHQRMLRFIDHFSEDEMAVHDVTGQSFQGAGLGLQQ